MTMSQNFKTKEEAALCYLTMAKDHIALCDPDGQTHFSTAIDLLQREVDKLKRNQPVDTFQEVNEELQVMIANLSLGHSPGVNPRTKSVLTLAQKAMDLIVPVPVQYNVEFHGVVVGWECPRCKCMNHMVDGDVNRCKKCGQIVTHGKGLIPHIALEKEDDHNATDA